MYICVCKAVSDSQIRQAVDSGARSVRELRDRLGLGSCCGKCVPSARGVIREHEQSTSVRRYRPAGSVNGSAAVA